MRLALFQKHLAAVEVHNGQGGRASWRAGVNGLADRTPEELQALRGYRRPDEQRSEGVAPSSLGFIGASVTVRSVTARDFPAAFTWKGRLKAMTEIRDQGSCGSCWAVASTVVMRAHSELYQTDRTFSPQQLLACVPNRRKCGGAGGCQGATSELAMDYIAKVGLSSEEQVNYLGRDQECPPEMRAPADSFRSVLKQAVAFPEVEVVNGGGATFGMTGWQKLPPNRLEPLLHAVYEKGPVAVSVAATDSWNMYASGIMHGCGPNATINHAVVLVGYGKEAGDDGQGYWEIQNSWGPSWGEHGFVRMLRREQEEEYCGMDGDPLEGTGCVGGPPQVEVCGNCGILYDSVVPKFEQSKQGWLSRFSRDVAVAVGSDAPTDYM